MPNLLDLLKQARDKELESGPDLDPITGTYQGGGSLGALSDYAGQKIDENLKAKNDLSKVAMQQSLERIANKQTGLPPTAEQKEFYEGQLGNVMGSLTTGPAKFGPIVDEGFAPKIIQAAEEKTGQKGISAIKRMIDAYYNQGKVPSQELLQVEKSLQKQAERFKK